MPIIIYHKNCIDGFMSMVICNYFLKKNIKVYGDVPSANSIYYNYSNQDIYIIDVAYKPTIIIEILSKCNSLTFIDHHITHYKAIKNIKNNKFTFIFNKNKSGALLTWTFFTKKSIPKSIQYISDNDTGTWKFKDTLNFISAIGVKYPFDETLIKKWYKLFNDTETNKLIKKGKIYVEYNNYLLETKYKNHILLLFPSEFIFNKYLGIAKKINQYTVAVHNGSCPTTTLIGNYILNNTNCDICFIFTYNIKDNVYIISLRSKKYDVSKIAAKFGGGGHKYAAAFKYKNITELFTHY